MTTPSETAASAFSQSFNCSQSVFSAFASQFGLERQTALKLASPFGGGFARRGGADGHCWRSGWRAAQIHPPGRMKFIGFRRNSSACSRKSMARCFAAT